MRGLSCSYQLLRKSGCAIGWTNIFTRSRSENDLSATESTVLTHSGYCMLGRFIDGRDEDMRKLFVLGLAVFIVGCAGKVDYISPSTIPRADNSKIINKPREVVWNVAVPALGKQFFVIRISPSRPFRGGEKPRPSPLSIGTPPQGRPARRVPQGDGGAPGLAAAQGRGWSAGHCGACGCPACSPAFLLTTSYEPHIDGMILAMREGRYLSTAAFLYLRALCRALGSGPLAR